MNQNFTNTNGVDIFNSEDKYLKDTLSQLFSNIYYTWDKDLYSFIDHLDSYNWRKTQAPSIVINSYIEENKFNRKEAFENVKRGLDSINNYINEVTWFEEKMKYDDKLKILSEKPIVYFSAEFGLVDWLQIYSGGLGILAADYIKQASDHGIPLVGIGLFYHQGYFHQDFDMHGMQIEHYIPQDPASSMLKLVRDGSGAQIEIAVTINDHDVYVRAWELQVGRVKLLLLDTNFEKNEIWEDRMITAHLYGGDEDTRIRQEIVLGIGGYRLIKQLGVNPSIVHLNEGHASFVILEKLAELKTQWDLPSEKIEQAKRNIVFTNHTLNSAGNDKFEYELLCKYLSPYAKNVNIELDTIFDLGHQQIYSGGQFSMTILGLKGSQKSNAVSKLHGEAAKKLWPDYQMEAITNGVHMPTWVAKPMQELLEKYVDPRWKDPNSNTDWSRINNIPDEELWETHKGLKADTIERLNKVLGCNLDKDKLTIIWTRRFALYKRPDIFLSDLNKLREIVSSIDKPVQFLVGGKAHPRDTKGKEVLQKVLQVTMSDEFKNNVVFLKGYNWNLARYLVAGTDVWMNNPIRFEEASGTSGMKSSANGVLQFTTLDGWTDEVDWSDKGFVIPQENISEEIYRIIKDQICPTFYEGKFSAKWVNMMKNTMRTVLEKYSTSRMLEDYIEMYKSIL